MGSGFVPCEVSASLAEELGLGAAGAGGEEAGGGKGTHRGAFSEGPDGFGAGSGGHWQLRPLGNHHGVSFSILVNRRERPKLDFSGGTAREQHAGSPTWSSGLPVCHKETKRQGRSLQSSLGRGEATWEVKGC